MEADLRRPDNGTDAQSADVWCGDKHTQVFKTFFLSLLVSNVKYSVFEV